MSDLIVLSPTETRVLDQLLSTGGSDEALACKLGMSKGTLREHVASLRKKFGAKSKSELMAIGWSIGWQGREAC